MICNDKKVPELEDALAPFRQSHCCHACYDKFHVGWARLMIVCPECGNKRCPKATNHEYQCTNSNEPNQEGSVYR